MTSRKTYKPKNPTGVPDLDENEIRETLKLIDSLEKDKKYNKLLYFKPYPYQAKLFEMGAKYAERFFQAGNQIGKSEGGAFEVACHATGLYPKWWKGIKYAHPIKILCAGKDATIVRNTIQTKLCGPYGSSASFGTGLLPKSCLVEKPSRGHGVTDAFDTVFVEHFTKGVKDGQSQILFFGYDAGREKFMGDVIDFLWLDEPPPQDVFGEATRGVQTRTGRVLITATPLEVKWIVDYYRDPHPDRAVLHAALDDCPVSEEEKNRRLERYLPHERDARRKGTLMIGEAHVFGIDESEFKIAPVDIPAHWPLAWAIDFGIGHAFAAVLLAWDRDTNTIYMVRCIKRKGQSALQHVAEMMSICAEAPVIWPHDGHVREKGSGIPLAQVYRDLGLNMCPVHATFPTGGYQFEGGIANLHKRLLTKTFKAFNFCTDFFEEYRYYSRKDGQVVKQDDDVLSAWRIGCMAIHMARESHMGGHFGQKRRRDTHDDELMSKPYDPWGAARDDYNPFEPNE